MANKNDTLPDNLKGLIESLSTQQAMPLGTMSDLPFLAVKVPLEYENILIEGGITCELKPAVFNIDFEEKTIAICFVQVRLNTCSELTYTAYYDLSEEKQYSDCYELLNMRNYGILAASEQIHDFIGFDVPFEAEFDPRNIIAGAKANATESTPALAHSIAQLFVQQSETPAKLWDQLSEMAPFEKSWYGRMRMESK